MNLHPNQYARTQTRAIVANARRPRVVTVNYGVLSVSLALLIGAAIGLLIF